jgi:hypothetical protein
MAPIVSLLSGLGLKIFSTVIENGTEEIKKKTLTFIKDKTGLELKKIKNIEELDVEKLKALREAEIEYSKEVALMKFTIERDRIKIEDNQNERNLQNDKLKAEDKQNARALQANLNSLQSTPWLVKNTGSMIALFTTVFTFGLWFAMLMNFTAEVNENILFAINSGLTLSLGYVLSFYFGSSKNESDLQRSKIHKEEVSTSKEPTDIIEPSLPTYTTITNEELEVK